MDIMDIIYRKEYIKKLYNNSLEIKFYVESILGLVMRVIFYFLEA